MRCIACNAKIFGVSYKKYLAKNPKTGKNDWIETKEVEDLCSSCLQWTYDEAPEETLDIHNDLSIGMDLPFKNEDY